MKIVKAAEATGTGLFLFYGQAKTYKTTTALLIPPELRPVGYFDADRGAYMRLRMLTATQAQRDKMGIVEAVPPYAGPWVGENIDFIYPEAERYYADCHEFVTQHVKNYKTVVIDTASRIGDAVIKEITHSYYQNLTPGKDATKMRVKVVTPGGMESEHPILSDYGYAQDRIMELIKALHAAPCHVVLISHEKTGEIKDSSGNGRIIAGPRSVGNALLEVIPSMMDVALRFEPTVIKGRSAVKLRSINHGGMYIAGDRSGTVPDGLVLDPQDLWKRLQLTIGLGAEGG